MSDLGDLDQLEQEMVAKLVVRRDALEEKIAALKREQTALVDQLHRVRRHLGLLGVEAPRKTSASSNGKPRGGYISREKLEAIVQAMLAEPKRAFAAEEVAALAGVEKSSARTGIHRLREQEIVTPMGKAPRKPGQHGTAPETYKIVEVNANAFLAEA